MLSFAARRLATVPCRAGAANTSRLARWVSTYYTTDHEYIRVRARGGWAAHVLVRIAAERRWRMQVDGDTGTLGITDFAQAQLGDIVYVELPNEGAEFNKG